MGTRYFCDACGDELEKDNHARNNCFGYSDDCERAFLRYEIICSTCIDRFRDGINETVSKIKNELNMERISKRNKQ